jgi:hypothetical protein
MAPSYIIRVVFKAFDFQPFRLLFLGSGSTATRSRFAKPRYGGGAGDLDRRATASSEPTEREHWQKPSPEWAGVL